LLPLRDYITRRVAAPCAQSSFSTALPATPTPAPTPHTAPRHRDVPRRRRWRRLEQKPRLLLEARWAGQDARIQRSLTNARQDARIQRHQKG
jgi:hypothetical protein